MKINLNQQVTVTPNAKGWEIYNKSWIDLGIAPPDHEETLTLALWDMARIFGKHLIMGYELPFTSTEIELKELS